MDEFDGFDPGEPGEEFDDDAGLDDQAGPAAEFDAFDEPEGTDDLGGLDFDDGEPEPGIEPGIEDAFDVEADFDDEPPGASDETAYGATYEQMLVAEADNPPAFPPDLDLDVPEPVDGYPWVDLDTLGPSEAEPWVNTVDDSPFATADLDDPTLEALARFWDR